MLEESSMISYDQLWAISTISLFGCQCLSMITKIIGALYYKGQFFITNAFVHDLLVFVGATTIIVGFAKLLLLIARATTKLQTVLQNSETGHQ